MYRKSVSFLLIILGVMLVAVIAGGAYFLSQITPPTRTPSNPQLANSPNLNGEPDGSAPTAGWKTYTDAKSGFSLDYPSDYFKFQGDPTLGFYAATSMPQGGNSPKFLGQNDVWLTAGVLNNAGIRSLDQYLTTQQVFYGVAQKTIITLDGINGYKITYNTQAMAAGNTSTTIYGYEGLVIKDNNLYTVSLSAFKQSILESDRTTFDQILSTFHFTN